MKILFTGGGTGGHFYPIIAVAEELRHLIKERRLVDAELYFMSDSPYDEKALYEHGILYRYAPAGKVRRYFSILNFIDLFKTGLGVLIAIWKMYLIYPDVVFGKGGYASFPAIFAARLLRIPIVIHESDSVPGRVSSWAAKFATKIAISYPEAAKFFPLDKTALTGIPIRSVLRHKNSVGAKDFFELPSDRKIILVIGGSQGSNKISDVLIDILPELLKKYSVIHQTGRANFQMVKARSEVALSDNENAQFYKPLPYLSGDHMALAAGAASLVVSRAGSTAIAEISNWELPSLLIPIPEDVSHDQTKNALAYAKTGACVFIEEHNLKDNILLHEIVRILDDDNTANQMKRAAVMFKKPDAGKIIAENLLSIALSHE